MAARSGPAAERKYVRVKLQRAEAAPVRSVAGLFASTLYVDNLAQVGCWAAGAGGGRAARPRLLSRGRHLACSRRAPTPLTPGTHTRDRVPNAPPLVPQSCANEPLRRLFSEYGEVTSCHLPRSTANPSLAKGFAFVHFRHSFAADA
jgi:RNA recognition motif-containing protein